VGLVGGHLVNLVVDESDPGTARIGTGSTAFWLSGGRCVAAGSSLCFHPSLPIGIGGAGFRSGSHGRIRVFSSAVDLGGFDVLGDGSFAADVQLPNGLAAGDHTMEVEGVDPSGAPLVLSVGVQVMAAGADGAGSPATSLPATGSDSARMVMWAIALIGLGGALAIVGRRRQRA
jgi:LPXTG-motif cell wall-anchored protein